MSAGDALFLIKDNFGPEFSSASVEIKVSTSELSVTVIVEPSVAVNPPVTSMPVEVVASLVEPACVISTSAFCFATMALTPLDVVCILKSPVISLSLAWLPS